MTFRLRSNLFLVEPLNVLQYVVIWIAKINLCFLLLDEQRAFNNGNTLRL